MPEDAVSTSLPELTLQPGSVIRVNSDSGAIITELVIKGFQVTQDERPTPRPLLIRRGGT